jgi:hypothetical protein
MNCTNNYDYDNDGIVYFEDWRKGEGYKNRDSLICSGMTEDEFNKFFDELEDEFFEYCEKMNLEGELV